MADDFKTRAFNFYVSQGLAPHVAAAIAGHADQESGGRTSAIGDGGKAFGIMQWHPDRQQGLAQFARDNRLDPTDETTQLKFVVHEMNTTERDAGAKLNASKNYKEANNAMMSYLRPAGYTPDHPEGGHNYAGRWNAGASLIGEAPIAGGTAVASADGTAAPASTGGLLQAQLDKITADQAARLTQQKSDAEKAGQDKAQDAFFADLGKMGTGLLGKAETKPVQVAQMAAPGIHAPEPGAVPLPNYTQAKQPDFMQMLMQQRLQRRT